MTNFTKTITPEVTKVKTRKGIKRVLKFRAALDGEFVGYFSNYNDAELALNEQAHKQLLAGILPKAA